MKVLCVMEYDVDGDDATIVLDNLAIVSEDGVRPTQVHLLMGLSALKVLSVVATAG